MSAHGAANEIRLPYGRTKVLSNAQAVDFVDRRAGFENRRATLSGRHESKLRDSIGSALPEHWHERLNRALRAPGGAYVVYSYSTPIGWTEGDSLVIPAIAHTETTFKHQSVIRNARGARWISDPRETL